MKYYRCSVFQLFQANPSSVTKIYRTLLMTQSSNLFNPLYSTRPCSENVPPNTRWTRCYNERIEEDRKGLRGTKLCKTVAGLYFNLIHGSGNRKDRPRRRWLKTGTWGSYEVPDEISWLSVSTPCGKFFLTRFHLVFLYFYGCFSFFITRKLWRVCAASWIRHHLTEIDEIYNYFAIWYIE